MNVYLLLDRSGSMSTLWSEAIGSINGYVSKLKKTDKVTVAAFDSVSYDVVRDVKVKEWTDIKDTEVSPRGGTPLYDACGKLMTQAETEKAKKTVLVVMTDGYENASQEYTQAAIKAKIKAFEDKKWEVIFLGANFDAVEGIATGLGVVGSKSMSYGVGNFARGMDILATSTAAYATYDSAINFSDEDKKLVSKSVA
jgi:Mg-chelatase subunit ChlD